MKRATKTPSEVFRDVLKQADEQIALAAKNAANFKHKVIRGDERANSLRDFMDKHLAGVFKTGKGEAIDYKDQRTGQLDFFIYDASTAVPILSARESDLIPAEALYVIVEVKSVLTQDELNTCAIAAKKVRALQPFKERFVASRTGGNHSEGHRCLYIVFAYTSNLGESDWAKNEMERINLAIKAANGSLDMIDRVLVMDRGMIRPQVSMATLRDETKGMFLEFYLHVVNFLTRERKRRPEIDWTAYTSRSRWIKIR